MKFPNRADRGINPGCLHLFITASSHRGIVSGIDVARDCLENGAPMNWLNLAVFFGSLTTGGLLYVRYGRWPRSLRRPAFNVLIRRAHLLFGSGLVTFFVFGRFFSGEEEGTTFIETINPLFIGLLVVTGALQFAKPPWFRGRPFAISRNVHIVGAAAYAAKFFAEPLFGGKLG